MEKQTIKTDMKKQTIKIDFAPILLPLEMHWEPKEDITSYELAICLPYLDRAQSVMPFEIDQSLSHFRHFRIIDHNKPLK